MHFLILVALVGLGAGCKDVGQACPSGETCSSMASNLIFQGARFSDDPADTVRGPGPTAVGGTQSVRVATGSDESSPDFSLPFDAKSNGPALGIGSVAGASVTVLGLQPGTAHLRIVEPGTELLYDRTSIDVAPVASVEIEPNDLPLIDDWLGDGQQHNWALLSGAAQIPVVVWLWGDVRFVDQSLTIMGGTQTSWDQTLVDAPIPGSISFSVRLGNGDTYGIDVPVVATLDEIVPVAPITSPIPVGQFGLYCFRGLSSGRPVYGATWEAAGSANIQVTAQWNCAGVSALQPGTATLTVTAGGLSQDFPISVVSALDAPQEIIPEAEL